jgi:hypothetical protein
LILKPVALSAQTKRARVIGATDQRTTSGPADSNSPHKKAEDMTAPTTSATPKITLDLRVPSRHDNADPALACTALAPKESDSVVLPFRQKRKAQSAMCLSGATWEYSRSRLALELGAAPSSESKRKWQQWAAE